jgi:pilus assembly protein CpaE
MLVSSESYQQLALNPQRPALVEYVAKPARLDELVLRVKAVMLRAGYELPATSYGSGNGHSEGADIDGFHHGTVTTIFSAKGGVGKTTIAANLAVGLVRFFRRKTLLVDADLWFGDVGVLMNLVSKKSLFDVCSGGEPDLTALQKAVVQHRSGVSVLLRPPDPLFVEKLDPDSVARAITTYKVLFDDVIVDTRPSFDEATLKILDAADRILLVTTPELSACHNTARFLGIAESLGYSHKLTLIVNRANSGIDMEALQETLGMTVSAKIVSAGRIVVDAASQGIPLFLKDPDLDMQITKDLARLVEIVAGKELSSHAKIRSKARFPFFGRRG